MSSNGNTQGDKDRSGGHTIASEEGQKAVMLQTEENADGAREVAELPSFDPEGNFQKCEWR